MIITNEKAAELIEYGQRMNVKVSFRMIGPTPVVNVRDQQFSDVRQAFLYLRHIEMSELPESLTYLVA